MRRIERILDKPRIYHIISEPNDMTRYDFLIIMDGTDNCTIAPYKSSFIFPQRFNYFEINNIMNIDDVVKYAKLHNIKSNPYTVLECIKVFKELVNKYER